MENNTGVTLTQLNISFTDEQWTEYEKPQELDFYYGTNLTALPLSSSTAGLADDSNLSWVTPSGNVAGSVTQMDGTSPANQHDVSGSISGLNWTSGSSLVLMWREATSGKSAAMAIDNFIFSADAAPPTVTNNGLTVSQGATATITTSQLLTSASPGSIPNSQITYTVDSTPASGALENDGTPLTTGSTFTQADIAAGNVTYTQNGSAATSDSFTFTVSDGVQTATAQTFIVTNPAGDQPPANIVPGADSAIKSTLLVYSAANGNAISIADPAVGSASIQVALSVSQGVLTLGSTTGVTVTAGSNGSGSLTLQGSVANVNNALIGLTYVPTTGYTGTDALQIVTDDLGNTSAGSPQTASSSVPITVVPPPLLNEIEANPPGTQDNRYEYVELQGAPGSSLTNVYLVVFDGIHTNNMGTADLVVNLSPYSFGSNGLLVVDAGSGFGHAIPAATTLVSSSFFTQTGGLNNGTLSFYLFFSTSPFVMGADYDATNEGVLDNLPSGSQMLDDVCAV